MNNTIEKVLKLRPLVRIAHHIPGRIRLKYQGGIVTKLAGLNASNIESTLARLPWLTDYKVTPSTGSILIEYDACTVTPNDIEALFSDDDNRAKLACYRIAELLNLEGESNE